MLLKSVIRKRRSGLWMRWTYSQPIAMSLKHTMLIGIG